MKPKQIVILSTLSAAIVLLFYVWHKPRKVEPLYRGKPVSWWVQQHTRRPAKFLLGDIPIRARREMADARLNAVLEIGTNAVPFLFDEIRQYGSEAAIVRDQVSRFLPRIALNVGRQYSNQDVMLNSIDALRTMGRPIVPELLAALQSPDASVREASAKAVGYIDPVDSDVITALVGLLQGRGTQGVCLGAIISLGVIGSQAKPAVPELEGVLQTGIQFYDFVSPLEAAKALAVIEPTNPILFSTLTTWSGITNVPQMSSRFVAFVNGEAKKLLSTLPPRAISPASNSPATVPTTNP